MASSVGKPINVVMSATDPAITAADLAAAGVPIRELRAIFTAKPA